MKYYTQQIKMNYIIECIVREECVCVYLVDILQCKSLIAGICDTFGYIWFQTQQYYKTYLMT